MEVVAPRWFGAPELRNGYLENPTKSADVYSLGKLLYWLFTGNVYDREEQDYEQRRLAQVLNNSVPAYAFADELVEVTVKYKPSDRKISDAKDFGTATRQNIDRIKAGGHVLDLNVPQRCIFCGLGFYRPAHDHVSLPPSTRPTAKWPVLEARRDPPRLELPAFGEVNIYATMREVADIVIGNKHGKPLLLVCDRCGNVQYFRLDLADGYGKNWRP